MAISSFCCGVCAGGEHVSPRALQLASRTITQGGRQCTGCICSAQGDRVTKALDKFVTGRTVGKMAFNLTTLREWQFEVHVVREQDEDFLAILRMVFHAEEPGLAGTS